MSVPRFLPLACTAPFVYILCMAKHARKPAAKIVRKRARPDRKRVTPGKPATAKKALQKNKPVRKAARKVISKVAVRKTIRRPNSSADVLAIFGKAVVSLGTEPAAQLWFERPKRRLNGLSPNEACKTQSGRSSVSQWLDEIADGAVS